MIESTSSKTGDDEKSLMGEGWTSVDKADWSNGRRELGNVE